MKSWLLVLAASVALSGISPRPAQAQPVAPPPSDAAASDGVRRIEISTPSGRYRVWTRRVGENPRLKVLLLHGGPAMTHEYLEAFEPYLLRDGIEFYYYDQLGAGESDRPKDNALWTIPRYVDEVEQVRKALGLTRNNFCLFGHSWGGILAIEYSLKHPKTLKCLIISNMMASIPAYNAYARRVLEPMMDPAALAEVKALEAAGRTDDPRYLEILFPQHYEQHVLRRAAAEWPEPVMRTFSHVNSEIYALLQGPSELGASGRIATWDRFSDLSRIHVPTLVIGARNDTMDPAHMARMAKRLPKGRYLYSAQGSHLAMWDDQETYFAGLTAFLKDVE